MDDEARPAVEAAPAERAADVGWEPADWDQALRRQWRAEWHDAVALLLLVGVVLPLERVLMSDRPLVGWYLLGLFWPLVLAAHVWRSRSSAERRARWERQTRQQIRVEHALRHHVSIGAADRGAVTQRAEEIDAWSWVPFAGWPVLAAVALLAIGNEASLSPAWKWLLAVVVLTVAAWLFRDARRRLQWALRWLDDPLPPPEEGAGATGLST